MGSHEELMAKGTQGAFAALVQLQQKAHQDESIDTDIDTATATDTTTDTDNKPPSNLDPASRHSNVSIHRRSISSSGRKSFDDPSRLSTSKSTNSNISTSNSLSTTTKNTKMIKPSTPSFRRLLALNKPEWRQAILGLTGAIAFGFVQPFYAFFLGDMMAVYYDTPSKMRHYVKIYSAVFCGLAVAAFVVNTLQHYNFAVMGEYLTKRIRVNMLVNVLRFEVGWFDRDENASGAICSRLASDSNMVRALDSLHID